MVYDDFLYLLEDLRLQFLMLSDRIFAGFYSQKIVICGHPYNVFILLSILSPRS